VIKDIQFFIDLGTLRHQIHKITHYVVNTVVSKVLSLSTLSIQSFQKFSPSLSFSLTLHFVIMSYLNTTQFTSFPLHRSPPLLLSIVSYPRLSLASLLPLRSGLTRHTPASTAQHRGRKVCVGLASSVGGTYTRLAEEGEDGEVQEETGATGVHSDADKQADLMKKLSAAQLVC
jgi:hypothetical protein